MKKRLFSVIVGLTLVLTLLFATLPGCGGGGQATPPPITPTGEPTGGTWKWQHNLPASDPMYFMAERIADDVKVGTGGRLTWELMPQGTAVANTEILDAVGKGTVDVGTCWDSQWADKDPAFYLIGGFPGGMTVYESVCWSIEDEWAEKGGGWGLRDATYAKFGVKSLPVNFGPPLMDYLGSKSISKPGDYKGLKVRAAGLTAKVLAEPEFGCTVSSEGEADVYAALEKGTIDAAFVGTPSENATLNLPKVAKFAGFPGMQQQCRVGSIIINMAKWNSLGDDIKTYVKWMLQETAVRSYAYQVNNDVKAFNDMKAAGITTVSQDKDLQTQWSTVSWRLMDKFAASDAAFKKAFDTWKEVLDLIRPYMAMNIPNYDESTREPYVTK